MPQPFILPDHPEGTEVPAFGLEAIAQLHVAEDDRDRMNSVLRRVSESQEKLLSPVGGGSRYTALNEHLDKAFAEAQALETNARATTHDIVMPFLTQLGLRRLDIVEVAELTARFGDGSLFETKRLRYETFEVFRQNAIPVFVQLNGCLVDAQGVEHRNVEAKVMLRPGSYVRSLGR